MSDTETHEVLIDRYFAASPAAVYRAFLEPEQLAQWWGPEAFATPTDSITVDARPGGAWTMRMVSDEESIDNTIEATFVELVPDRRIVATQKVEGIPGIEGVTAFTLTIDLHADGDGTRLELRQGPHPVELSGGASVGWNQSFDKLDRLLA